MNIPEEYRQDYEAMPEILRELLDAELAAGNEIDEVGHSFPAPPVGAYFKLKNPVTTRPRAAGEGIRFRDFNSSIYSGEFTDDKRFFFVLEPPGPPPPEPDMNAIRAAVNIPSSPRVPLPPLATLPAQLYGETPLDRFRASMDIDYEKWHDGIGYDLKAIEEASEAEKKAIESLLLPRANNDWRDVEALAALKTSRAKDALKQALKTGNAEIRMAVSRHAPELMDDRKRTASLVKALVEAEIYAGLSATLDEAVEYHPEEVVDALLRAALERKGDVAYHCAATLLTIFGKITSRHDWDQRPFLLRFVEAGTGVRREVFRDLCDKIGVNHGPYLKRPPSSPRSSRR